MRKVKINREDIQFKPSSVSTQVYCTNTGDHIGWMGITRNYILTFLENRPEGDHLIEVHPDGRFLTYSRPEDRTLEAPCTINRGHSEEMKRIYDQTIKKIEELITMNQSTGHIYMPPENFPNRK